MKNFIKNPRVRGFGIAGLALVVLAGVGISVASASAQTSDRWVTATAATGDVTQSYTTTGTITRKNTAEASFSATGTVTKVSVSVGSQVTAGSVLAALDTRSLKLAVLNAETSVAKAKSTLYDAQNPSSASSNSAGSPGNASGNSNGGTTTSVDLSALNKAVTRVNTAVMAESAACDSIVAWMSEDLSATGTPSAAATAEPTLPQLQSCASARAEVSAANKNLQQVSMATNQQSGPSKSGSTTSANTSTTVSATAVASAKAALLKTQQELQSAQDDLTAASLVAPISGTVASVGLSVGNSASAGSITIVGAGEAVVSIELPLATRGSLAERAAATVTPAGSLTALSGTVTNISLLETSGTSGSTATYATVIAVTDPDQRLASGAKASVSIPVKTATGVVTVPISALTPTGTGTGTVAVLAAGATTPVTTTVSTGAVGGGVIEITKGLSAGQVVVLADRQAGIPSSSTRKSATSSSNSSTSSSSSQPTNK